MKTINEGDYIFKEGDWVRLRGTNELFKVKGVNGSSLDLEGFSNSLPKYFCFCQSKYAYKLVQSTI